MENQGGKPPKVSINTGIKSNSCQLTVGESFSLLGKYPEAEQMHRQALELRTRALNREHPSMLDSMSHLALAFERLGRYNEAEQMQRQVLKLRIEVLNQEHPSMLNSINHLASVLEHLGRYDEAK
jgi:tetratricopeptide (TPR) repeat protein